MTSERYAFNATVRERSELRHSASARKCGSHSKKCTMPSDYLTAAQKRKLNGEIFTMKMNEPIKNLDDFRKLPTTMQRNYFQYLIDNFGADATSLANMLGISRGTFRALTNNFAEPLVLPKGRANNERKSRWAAFLNGTTVTTNKLKSTITPVEKPVAPSRDSKTSTETTVKKIVPSHGALRFTSVTAPELAAYLTAELGSTSFDIEIKFTTAT